MFSSYLTQRQATTAELAYRRRALQTNSAIYSRRHGPDLLPLLSRLGGPAQCARYAEQIARLAEEAAWEPHYARRVAALAHDLARSGRLRGEDPDHVSGWHAARLRELVGQYETITHLEASLTGVVVWPCANQQAVRRRRSVRGGRSA